MSCLHAKEMHSSVTVVSSVQPYLCFGLFLEKTVCERHGEQWRLLPVEGGWFSPAFLGSLGRLLLAKSPTDVAA